MAKKNKNLVSKILFFILGMILMLGLDIIFHFNNSVKTGIDRELNNTQRKIENVFK